MPSSPAQLNQLTAMPSSLIHPVHRKKQAALPQITASSLLAPKPTSNFFLTFRAIWNLEAYYLLSWVNNTKATITPPPPIFALSYPWKSLSLNWAAPSTGRCVDHVHTSVAEQEELKSLCLFYGYFFCVDCRFANKCSFWDAGETSLESWDGSEDREKKISREEEKSWKGLKSSFKSLSLLYKCRAVTILL